MCLPLLVSPDCPRFDAYFEAQGSLLGQGCCCSSNFLRFVSVGSHRDQRVCTHFLDYQMYTNAMPSGGELVTGKAKITSPYMNTAYSALTGLNVIIGLFSSLAVNMPDFGRFSKNNLKGPHQFLALPIIGTLGALTPIFVTSAHSYLWGEFQWYVAYNLSSEPVL